MFRDSLALFNCDIYSLFSLLFAGFFLSDILCFHFSHKLSYIFTPKKKRDLKKNKATVQKKPSKVLKWLSIIIESFIIIILFTAVNSSVAFFSNRVSLPEDNVFVLRQETIRYEYIDSVYKTEGFYLNDSFIENEHYIIKTKNDEIINLVYYLDGDKTNFEKEVLPLLQKNGCEIKEIKSEKDIK